MKSISSADTPSDRPTASRPQHSRRRSRSVMLALSMMKRALILAAAKAPNSSASGFILSTTVSMKLQPSLSISAPKSAAIPVIFTRSLSEISPSTDARHTSRLAKSMTSNPWYAGEPGFPPSFATGTTSCAIAFTPSLTALPASFIAFSASNLLTASAAAAAAPPTALDASSAAFLSMPPRSNPPKPAISTPFSKIIS